MTNTSIVSVGSQITVLNEEPAVEGRYIVTDVLASSDSLTLMAEIIAIGEAPYATKLVDELKTRLRGLAERSSGTLMSGRHLRDSVQEFLFEETQLGDEFEVVAVIKSLDKGTMVTKKLQGLPTGAGERALSFGRELRKREENAAHQETGES